MMQHGVPSSDLSAPSVVSRDPNLGPRSPTSVRRSRPRQFVALNPDPASSSSSSPPVLHPPGSSIHSPQFLPDPRLHLNVQPPPNIHAPLESESPAVTMMNVDPDAPVLGMAGDADLESQRETAAVQEERRAEGITRKNTLSKGKNFIGGFVPWLRKDNNKHMPPPVPEPSEALAPSASTLAPTTESKSARTTQSQASSYNAPTPTIRVESPSTRTGSTFHGGTPFIPPTPDHTFIPPSPSGSSIQQQQPVPQRPPSPSVEGTTLVGHGTLMPEPFLLAEPKFTDPAQLALPNSPEYKPLPHAADYAIMQPFAQKDEGAVGQVMRTHPLIERVKDILKTIDEFPWIGEERITADYYPTRTNKDGKPWRFGHYEKRKPLQPDPTRPHGDRLPNEPQGSPTFGFHRSSRYDFGIRRSQFSRLRRPRSKRSGIGSWYGGGSQKSNKELDLFGSSSGEIDPFPLPMPVPAIATTAASEPKEGLTPVSMKTIPLYEQRMVDGQAVDIDVDLERAMMQQLGLAEDETQRSQVRDTQINHQQSPAPGPSVPPHVPSASVRSPTITIQSPPPPDRQPRNHSRSRSDDQGQPVYATRTYAHDFATSQSHSHHRSRSVDYYISASQQGIPPQNFTYTGSEGRGNESSDPSRTNSIRVSSPRKPKRRSHSTRTRSTTTPIHYQPTIRPPVYYATPPSIPSGYGHRRYNSQAGSSSGTRRDVEHYTVPA